MNLDLPSEVNHTEKEKYPMMSLIQGILKKLTYLQNCNRLTDLENELIVVEEKGEGLGQTGSLGLTRIHFYI